MNTRSLKFRLTAWYAGCLTLLFIIFAVFVYYSLDHYLRKSLREALARRTRQIAELVQRFPQTWDSAGHVLPAAFASEANNRFTRVTINESVRYVSGPPSDASFDPSAVPPAPTPGHPGETFEHRTLPDGRALYLVVLERDSNGRRLVVEEGLSAQFISGTLHAWLAALVAGLIVLICAAVFGGFTLIQSSLAPVDEITRTAERISLQNLNARLPVAPTHDEIERLSIALNGMMDRLEGTFEQTRRFLADASHELRTPVTIIQAELDTLTANEAMPPALTRYANSALEETERLRKIVHALFALSRFDAGEALQERSPVDLGELARVATDQMRLLAEDRNIEITCSTGNNLKVLGDSSRLKQVILNLVDNAIKYTQPGGHIDVTLRAINNTAVLVVSDTGIGIPTEALPHLFERFFRVDKARSREMGGAGLGLAIVKAICTAHRGSITAHSEEGKGSRFAVELPLLGQTETAPPPDKPA